MTWQEILKFMFEGASSQDPARKDSALHIFRYPTKSLGLQSVNITVLIIYAIFSVNIT